MSDKSDVSEIKNVQDVEEVDVEVDDVEEDVEVEDDAEDDTEEVKDDSKKVDRKIKKKKHYFEHHIRKILKEVCSDRDITQQAKSQLNDLAIITCKLISNKITHILRSSNKKTITENEIESAIKLIFTGQLCQKSVEEGKKSLQNYLTSSKDEDLKGQSRHVKAHILIPPSILEKFLRVNDTHISYHAPIFLAGVIEYFLSQLLELANNVSINKNKKGVRITVYDLESGVRSDRELDTFFTKNNIYFYNSGIVPFIHPHLKTKSGSNDKKSIKIISKLQEEQDYVFPKSFIENKFKNYISLIYPEIRFQKDCFTYFQDYLEKWLVEFLQQANNLTLYSKKTRVSENDIELVLAIMEKRYPDFLNTTPSPPEDHIAFNPSKSE